MRNILYPLCITLGLFVVLFVESKDVKLAVIYVQFVLFLFQLFSNNK